MLFFFLFFFFFFFWGGCVCICRGLILWGDPVFRRFPFVNFFFRNSYSSFFFEVSDTVEVPIPILSASCFWFNFGTNSAARIKSI